jgi:hypothetical protein
MYLVFITKGLQGLTFYYHYLTLLVEHNELILPNWVVAQYFGAIFVLNNSSHGKDITNF